MKFFCVNLVLTLNVFFLSSCKLVTPKETQLSADRFATSPTANKQENIIVKNVYQNSNSISIPLSNFAIYSAIFCDGDTAISYQPIFSQTEQVIHILSNKQCTITIEKFVLDNLEYLPTILIPVQKLVFTVLPDKTIQIPSQPVSYHNGSSNYYLKGTSSENNILEFIISDSTFSKVYIK